MLALKNKEKRKKQKISISVLILFFLEFNLVISNAFGRNEILTENWTEDIINPNESVSYHFPNDIIFEITSNSRIDLSIEYEKRIKNRQSSIFITNNESISLDITSKINMRNFGISKPPDSPKKGNFQLRYQYNCIFKIKTNSTIENFTFRYRKISQFGLKSNINYSLAIFDLNQETWELVDTEEKRIPIIGKRYTKKHKTRIDFFDSNQNFCFLVTRISKEWFGVHISKELVDLTPFDVCTVSFLRLIWFWRPDPSTD